MKPLSIKVNGEDQGILILCKCGNLVTVNPEELKALDKTILQCGICKDEIVVTKDTE